MLSATAADNKVAERAERAADRTAAERVYALRMALGQVSRAQVEVMMDPLEPLEAAASSDASTEATAPNDNGRARARARMEDKEVGMRLTFVLTPLHKDEHDARTAAHAVESYLMGFSKMSLEDVD